MKTNIFPLFFFALLLFLLPQQLKGQQEPFGPHFAYQAVVRNADHQLVVNQKISIRISILENSLVERYGSIVYQEVHHPFTNGAGLFSIEVGHGTPIKGIWKNIASHNTSYYLVSDIDPQGVDNYTQSSSQKLLSVPFAFSAESSASTDSLIGFHLAEHNAHLDNMSAATDSLASQISQLKHQLPPKDTTIEACDQITLDGQRFFSSGTFLATIHDWPYRIHLTIHHTNSDTVYAARPDWEAYNGEDYFIQYCFWDFETENENTHEYEDSPLFYWHGINVHPYDDKSPYSVVDTLYWDGYCPTTTTLILYPLQRIRRFVEWGYTDNIVSSPITKDGHYQFLKDDTVYSCEFSVKPAFSVSASKQVYFSPGNLAYSTSGTHKVSGGGSANGTWYFEPLFNPAIDNQSISSSSSSDIDLFGWGTSGWSSGAQSIAPYSQNTSYSNYYPGGSYANNLTGSYAKADWGVYNAISNGGNEPNQWRTLTASEWKYLISERPNATDLMFFCQVYNEESESVFGLLLLPDKYYYSNYSNPIALDDWLYVTCYSSKHNPQIQGSYYLTSDFYNELSSSDDELVFWSFPLHTIELYQRFGAVFLPFTGMRNGTSVSQSASNGYYWSSSHGSSKTACYMCFSTSKIYPRSDGYRNMARAVRLVKNVK